MASKLKTVLEAWKTALETDYSTTVYKPDVVQVVLFWPDESAIPVGHQTIYLIRPGAERGGPGPTSCEITESLEVTILALHRYDSTSESPFTEDPARWEIAADLVADVKEKLRGDEKLGGEVLTSFSGAPGDQMRVDYERYLPRWVLAELGTVVRYRYEKTSR